MIFCSFIVKDWFRANKNYVKYHEFNKKLVKLYILHYWKY